jgi:hypothetical protein
MNTSETTASAELGLRLIGPEHKIVPLMAGLYYTRYDPYAIRMAFHIGTDQPVEWIVDRDLLMAGLTSRQGSGDIRVWPSSRTSPGLLASDRADADAEADAEAGCEILHIEISPPTGGAHFEALAEAVHNFLQRTYRIVPAGQEGSFMDIDAELDEILRKG